MIKLKKILLAEDDPKDVELTIEAFEENNLANQLVVVRDGVKAMEYLTCSGEFSNREAGNPSVVILDIKMPRMNGIEVLEAIRKDKNLKLLPVVMLTSSREEQDLLKTYNLGVNAYVVKPVTFSDFIVAVKQLGIFWAVINELPP